MSKELFEKISSFNFILLGDLNAKSKVFNRFCVNPNANGILLEDILIDNNIICLKNDYPTYLNFSSYDEDILDLGIISSSMFNDFEYFKVLSDVDMGSDHFPIELVFKLVTNRSESCFDSIKKVDWVKFKDNLPRKYPENFDKTVENLNKFICDSLLVAEEKFFKNYQM